MRVGDRRTNRYSKHAGTPLPNIVEAEGMLVPQSRAKHGTRWFMTGQIPVVRINSPSYNADA
jgi:hypothetical protein